MPIDYYPQKSEEELLVILEAVQKRSGEGVVSFTTAIAMQTQKSWQGAPPVDVALRRILYSLHLRNPTDYPDPDVGRRRIVRGSYSY